MPSAMEQPGPVRFEVAQAQAGRPEARAEVGRPEVARGVPALVLRLLMAGPPGALVPGWAGSALARPQVPVPQGSAVVQGLAVLQGSAVVQGLAVLQGSAVVQGLAVLQALTVLQTAAVLQGSAVAQWAVVAERAAVPQRPVGALGLAEALGLAGALGFARGLGAPERAGSVGLPVPPGAVAPQRVAGRAVLVPLLRVAGLGAAPRPTGLALGVAGSGRPMASLAEPAALSDQRSSRLEPRQRAGREHRRIGPGRLGDRRAPTGRPAQGSAAPPRRQRSLR
jgi:hypothetical protein